MKKLLSVLMAAAMLVGVLSLAGCGGNGGETTTDPAADADNSAATTETAGDLTTVTAGKLTMSTNAQFPPYEMVAPTTAASRASTSRWPTPSPRSWAWSCRSTTWTSTPPCWPPRTARATWSWPA